MWIVAVLVSTHRQNLARGIENKPKTIWAGRRKKGNQKQEYRGGVPEGGGGGGGGSSSAGFRPFRARELTINSSSSAVGGCNFAREHSAWIFSV